MKFPTVDPIPIPAPVWLMKALSLLTLAMHFFAVQILIGSLVAVAYFSFRGRKKGSDADKTAASVVAKRMPIVMTYVINLGIPPLLFAQVLYGRALYTSSILMAVSWISVIFLLAGVYWLLYRVAARANEGKPVAALAITALVLAAGVGDIYAMNMTLMLRPEVWQAMYAKSATGLQAPPHDPTTMPRWLFVVLGGLLVGGLWTMLQAKVATVSDDARTVLTNVGSNSALLGGVLQLGTGFWVYATQPEAVQAGLKSPWYMVGGGLWVAGVFLALVGAGLKKPVPAIGGLVGAFLGLAGAVIVRDGIRDLTLAGKGFDVWKRTEHSNWYVIGLFLLLFVIGLAAVGWLWSVMRRAQPISEEVLA